MKCHCGKRTIYSVPTSIYDRSPTAALDMPRAKKDFFGSIEEIIVKMSQKHDRCSMNICKDGILLAGNYGTIPCVGNNKETV